MSLLGARVERRPQPRHVEDDSRLVLTYFLSALVAGGGDAGPQP
jgi:hypothetical protein